MLRTIILAKQMMSTLLRKIFIQFKNHNISHQNPEILLQEYNKLEEIFIELYKIIIWRNPLISTLSIVLVNIIFWLIRFYNFKFYGIIFTSSLIMTFESLWSDTLSRVVFKKKNSLKSCDSESTVTMSHLELEDIHYSRSTLEKSRAFLRNAYDKAVWFRQIYPAGFCSLICACFLLLSFAGKLVSGVTSLYALLMLTMTLPGIALQFFPIYITNSLSNFYGFSIKAPEEKGIFACKDDNGSLDSFLPETNPEVLQLLELAGEVENDNESAVEDSIDIFLKSTEDETHYTGINFNRKQFDGDSSEEEFALELKLPKKKHNNIKLYRTRFHEENSCMSQRNNENKNLFSDSESLHRVSKSDGELSSDTDSFEIIL